MPTLTITESAMQKAQSQADDLGLGSVSEYFEELVEWRSHIVPPNSVSTREELEALILEALNNPEPSKPFTKRDFEDLKDELRALGQNGHS